MAKADDFQMYEQQVEKIQQANQPLLDGFEIWLRQSGLSEQTIKAHVDNMRFFSRYLLLSSYSLRRLDQATKGAVYDFLAKRPVNPPLFSYGDRRGVPILLK
jgi:hypothetical protein